MNTKSFNCPYCGSEAEGQTQENFYYVFVTCPTCGRYEYRAFPNTVGANIRDKVASYLYYNGVAVEHEDYRFSISLALSIISKKLMSNILGVIMFHLMKLKHFILNHFRKELTRF